MRLLIIEFLMLEPGLIVSEPVYEFPPLWLGDLETRPYLEICSIVHSKWLTVF